MIKKKGLAKLLRIIEVKPEISCKAAALKALRCHTNNSMVPGGFPFFL